LANYEVTKRCKKIVHKLSPSYPCAKNDNKPEVAQVKQNNHKRLFEFDAVLDENKNQQDVYIRSGAFQAVTEDLFLGFNCTILAYGQSGSGKTYTMGTSSGATGPNSIGCEDGVIPRACVDLFTHVNTKCNGKAQVTLSYVEVYNEEVRDLISVQGGSQDLFIRETPDGRVYVQGMTSIIVTRPEQVFRLMQDAQERRVVGSTKINDVSSRSHAICIMEIHGTFENKKFQSKLTLADLAGSERLEKTENTGKAKAEGISINKGLFVLGQVISALAEKRPQMKRRPPFRESKLTRILQDSLGGNSRTIMIACCSPADYHAEETVNSLRYATQARNIENPVTANIVDDQHTLSRTEAKALVEENMMLKNENISLRKSFLEENRKLVEENKVLLEKLLEYQEAIGQITTELKDVKIERNLESPDNNTWNTYILTSAAMSTEANLDCTNVDTAEAKEELSSRPPPLINSANQMHAKKWVNDQLTEAPLDKKNGIMKGTTKVTVETTDSKFSGVSSKFSSLEDAKNALKSKGMRGTWKNKGQNLLDPAKVFSTFYCGSGSYGAYENFAS
jgi:hypothetical protein